MAISENLTQQKFQEILLDTYLKGQQSTSINVLDLIEDIKQRLLVEVGHRSPS